MIPDNQKNKLFLADSLPIKYEDFYEKLEVLLKRYNVDTQFLSPTNDVWARDYMPVQVSEDRFVQFTYKPDYLKAKSRRKSISDVDRICEKLSLNITKSDIVLDGGNVVHSANTVILCDKVFKENAAYTCEDLTNKLRNLFETDRIFFLPTHPQDEFGHADGLVRFFDNDTILINDIAREDRGFREAFQKAVSSTGLNVIELPYNPYGNRTNLQAVGIYINYLQMENLILIPGYGMDEDKLALNKFEEIFKGQTIRQLDCNDIADDGGVLNCITWNLLSPKESAEIL